MLLTYGLYYDILLLGKANRGAYLQLVAYKTSTVETAIEPSCPIIGKYLESRAKKNNINALGPSGISFSSSGNKTGRMGELLCFGQSSQIFF